MKIVFQGSAVSAAVFVPTFSPLLLCGWPTKKSHDCSRPILGQSMKVAHEVVGPIFASIQFHDMHPRLGRPSV